MSISPYYVHFVIAWHCIEASGRGRFTNWFDYGEESDCDGIWIKWEQWTVCTERRYGKE
jgi:hypothetical protein